jgi:predicted RecB family nuclease
LHFGAYDTVAMKRMKARLREFLHTKMDRILERATNVLSVIHQHIYFPVYSNGLKDIGRFLGFEWTSKNATGLEAIVSLHHSHGHRGAVGHLLPCSRPRCLGRAPL